jgi:hypothetical protein
MHALAGMSFTIAAESNPRNASEPQRVSVQGSSAFAKAPAGHRRSVSEGVPRGEAPRI